MKLGPVKKNIIDLSAHLFVSLVFSVWVYLKTADLFYVFIVLAGGILIDLDHLIDHFLFFKDKFKLNDFLGNLYLRSGRLYVFFHSWEISLIFFILASSLKSYALFLFSLSFSFHLIIDNIQKRNLLFYSLIYRAYKKFDLSVLLPEDRERFLKKE